MNPPDEEADMHDRIGVHRIPSPLRQTTTNFSVGIIGKGKCTCRGHNNWTIFFISHVVSFTLWPLLCSKVCPTWNRTNSRVAPFFLWSHPTRPRRRAARQIKPAEYLPKKNLKRSGCVSVQRDQVGTLFHSDHQNPPQPDPSEDEGHSTDLV